MLRRCKCPRQTAPQSTKELRKPAGRKEDASGSRGGLAGQKEALSWLMTAFPFPNPVFPEVQLHFLTCAVSIIITPSPNIFSSSNKKFNLDFFWPQSSECCRGQMRREVMAVECGAGLRRRECGVGGGQEGLGGGTKRRLHRRGEGEGWGVGEGRGGGFWAQGPESPRQLQRTPMASGLGT